MLGDTQKASVSFEVWNHIKHLIHPQHYETINQLQGEKKKGKYVEAELNTTTQLKSSKRKLKNVCSQMIIDP